VTDTEIQMLITGAALGAQSMNVLHVVLDSRAIRRSGKAARRQARIFAADRYLSSLRLYQLQHRSRA
jgi:hypothetical protein